MASAVLEQAIEFVERSEVVPSPIMEEAMRTVMRGEASTEAVRQLLVALHHRGEDVSELVAAARVLREFMTLIPIQRRPVMDTCGTGGTGARLFNVSTASAIAAAACGVRIAKHGNRKVTSSTGSADVLSELGVAIDASHQVVADCVDQIGIGFCFAPQAHPAVRNVSEVRRSIPHPTLFNWLGPLCNPAEAEQQVLGVGQAALLGKFPTALRSLGVARFVVLHSDDGLCELSTQAATQVVVGTEQGMERATWSPSDFGVDSRDFSPVVVNSPAESAELIRSAFAGQPGIARDFVVMNAGAAVWLADGTISLAEAADRVRTAIDQGQVAEKLYQLVRASHAARE